MNTSHDRSHPARRALGLASCLIGVGLMALGLFRLSLPLMAAGFALWVTGGVVAERAAGRFR